MARSNTSTTTPRSAKRATGWLQNNFAMMTGLLSTVAAGTKVWTERFYASLHETRRQQAAEVLNRYRYLICDADADRQFGVGHRVSDPNLPCADLPTNENDKNGSDTPRQICR